MNALDSLNNTVPPGACNSGHSKFPTCRKILPEEKMASFSEGPSLNVYHSSAAV